MLVKNLRAYLANIEMSFEDFAKKLDVSSQYISRLASGKVTPSRRLSRDIKIATDGVIDLPARKPKYQGRQEQGNANPE